ncbi:MAG: xanthine dehydrogenase family protein molybdopterin-binding subunit [Acidimicrobiales bacterium]
MSFLGNRVLRKEDDKFLTVGGSYVDDLDIPSALWLAFLHSPVAHARVTRLDVSAAKSEPGVVEVLTAADLSLPSLPPDLPMINAQMAHPPLCDGKVRFVGDLIAAVVAETRAAAVDAIERIEVDYETLPVLVDPTDALAGTTLLFEEAGTNVAFEASFGHDDSLFEGCDVVVTQPIVNQRLAPCPLEVRSAAARVEDDGRLTVFLTSQTPFAGRDVIASELGLEPSAVHVISPDVGGGFGSKAVTYPQEVVVAAAAHRLRRPVRWTETRSESMLTLGHGRAQCQKVTIGGTRDGRVLAYRLEVLQDAGAYPSLGAFLPMFTRMMLTGTYDIAKAECDFTSVVTNTAPLVPYRGAGRPEATAAIERAVDLFATEIGMDPAEVRRRNVVKGTEPFPFTSATGTEYDIGNYDAALERLLEAAGYEELRAAQRARREANDTVQLGLGLSVYVEITNGLPGSEFSSVEVRPDGKAVVKTGTSPHGQGHDTAWSMLVAEEMGLAIDDVELIHSDTDLVASGVGTFGSRSLQMGGVATKRAAVQVVAAAKEIAAELLEASPEDIVLAGGVGGLQVAGTPTSRRSWSEIAHAAIEKGQPLLAEVNYTSPGPTFPFGAHLAVVEVDTETGRVVLQRMIALDDAGRILNPLLAEGQIHGGLAQGAAQALLEEFRYDELGNPLTSNFMDYLFVSATELPNFETVEMETPTPRNEIGAKGIGESGTIGSTPAVHNAIVDALVHLGVRHVDMPANPERIWRAISGARQGA